MLKRGDAKVFYTLLADPAVYLGGYPQVKPSQSKKIFP